MALHSGASAALCKLRNFVHIATSDAVNELVNIVNELNLADLNRSLYRCNEEESDEGRGIGVYNIPGFAPLVYCGLQGNE